MTERHLQSSSFVYHKKPGTSNMVDCDTNGMMCTAQEKYCGAFHIGNNYFVTGAHCLVATDGNIRDPYELDIVGVGLTEVKFVMHKNYAPRTGNDVAWVKIVKPIGVNDYILVADIHPYKCQNFALELHDPNAQGLRSGFRWIAENYGRKHSYKVRNHRPAGRTFRYRRGHTNAEIVTFCNTVKDKDKHELHYIFMGFRDGELFQTDCHVAKCSYISPENMQAPPVADIGITTIPVTTEVIVISSSEENEPNAGSSRSDSASSGSNSVESNPNVVEKDPNRIPIVDRNSNFVNKYREFVNSFPDITGSSPGIIAQEPKYNLSGPNYTIPHPSYEKSAPVPGRSGPKHFVNKDLEYVNSESDSSNSDSTNSDPKLPDPGPISVNSVPDLDRARPDHLKRDFVNKDLEYIHSEPYSENSGSNDVEDLHYVQLDPGPGIVDSDSNIVSSDANPDNKEPSKDERSREFSANDTVIDLSTVPPKEAEVDSVVDEANECEDDEDKGDDDGDEDDGDGKHLSPVKAAPQRIAAVSGFRTRSPVRIDHFGIATEQPWLQLWKQRMSSYFVKRTPEVARSAGYKPPEEKPIKHSIRQFVTRVRPTAAQKPLLRSYEKVPISLEIVVDIDSSKENEEVYKEDVIRITEENITNIPLVIPDMLNSPTDLPDVLDQNFDKEPKLGEANEDEVDTRELPRSFEWPPTFSDKDGLEYFDTRVFSDQNRGHFGTNFTPNLVPCDYTQEQDVHRIRTLSYKVTKIKGPSSATGENLTRRISGSASPKESSLLYGRLTVAIVVAVAIL
ncbi:uncharacterized protein LOC129770175 isoform X2 [Toxorhynchites rutilus septentrionalis]|uniref:uncharacterized protein LOC129770175 isoform X2 n=1 Tax=Toxorhynchites rutilus septentrionalis TaxID=329112 RepID=UPI002479DD24|nr:uncharacterized protein LOC129770175 isoform X2 [Toxorhynchites rutilus septentrionalis]